PHWIPEARGVVFGLTRGTTAADVSRATLEGVAFQVADLIDAAALDAGTRLRQLRVDGGMARNAWVLQCQADVLGLPVSAATPGGAAARGAAYPGGASAGLGPDPAPLRRLDAAARRFEPRLDEATRQRRRRQWQRAVQAVIQFYSP